MADAPHPMTPPRRTGIAELDTVLFAFNKLITVVIFAMCVVFDALATALFMFVRVIGRSEVLCGLGLFIIVAYSLLAGINIGVSLSAREYASEYQNKGPELVEFMRAEFYRSVVRAVDTGCWAKSEQLGLTPVLSMLVWLLRVLDFVIEGVVFGLVQLTASAVQYTADAALFVGGKIALCFLVGPLTAAVVMTFLSMRYDISIQDLLVAFRRWWVPNKRR